MGDDTLTTSIIEIDRDLWTTMKADGIENDRTVTEQLEHVLADYYGENND